MTSDLFQQRVDVAVITQFLILDNKSSSVGLRITFALNSWDVIKENPIIGIGTGDFPMEYKKINQINTPELPKYNQSPQYVHLSCNAAWCVRLD